METSHTAREKAGHRANFLRREIQRHNYLYYVAANPELTDREYDALYDELQELETKFPDLKTPDSPTNRVGGEPLKEFKTVRHLVPMLSLDKKKDTADLERFDARIRRELPGEQIRYVVEPKVDGVSIGLRYVNGRFMLGTTRGDGTSGDDITNNLRTLHCIPMRIMEDQMPPALLEVRGEAYLPPVKLAEINAALSQAGEKTFPNARNATAGSLKQLNPAVVAGRPLRAVFYAVGATEGITFSSQAATLETLKKLQFPVPQLWWICDTIGEAAARAEELRSRESELPYEIDGVVIKLDNMQLWSKLGATATHPVHAIAYKPKHWMKQAETRLNAITVQVGRTGILTPVAELEPVFLAGSTISRATLHNADEIARKDIRIGDQVIIEKAGMVIPAVVRALVEKRTGREKKFQMPETCPICGNNVIRNRNSGNDEAVASRCNNLQCPAQKMRRLEYMASRHALDIEGLGGVVANALFERELTQEPLDVFKLTLPQLAALNLGTASEPRLLGAKNAQRILDALEQSRALPLHRWLFALAIPEVGEATALQIAAIHRNLKEITNSPILHDIAILAEKENEADRINPKAAANRKKPEEERLKLADRHRALQAEITAIKGRLDAYKIPEVGPVVARSVLAYFQSDAGRQTLRQLDELNIHPSANPTPDTAGDKPLLGKTFVLTGVLASMSRDEAAARIQALGGIVTSAVSQKTSCLIAGEAPGSNKTDQAAKFNIPMLNEQDFLALLGNRPAPKSKPVKKTGMHHQGELF